MTQMEQARKGFITDVMRRVADKECVDPKYIRNAVAQGSVVIPANILHGHLDPVGIGKRLIIKVNANIGTSRDHINI